MLFFSLYVTVYLVNLFFFFAQVLICVILCRLQLFICDACFFFFLLQPSSDLNHLVLLFTTRLLLVQKKIQSVFYIYKLFFVFKSGQSTKISQLLAMFCHFDKKKKHLPLSMPINHFTIIFYSPINFPFAVSFVYLFNRNWISL